MLSHFTRVALCNIAEELRCHILSFLSYNDIICCALTCRTMYNTVKSSLRLQYLIQLGAQGLIPVHPRPSTVSVEDCLHILRDNARTWDSFELNVTKRLMIISTPWYIYKSISITHQQLNLSTNYLNFLPTYSVDLMSKIIDLKTCTPEMAIAPPFTVSGGSLNPVPGTPLFTSCIDATQDLIITVNLLDYPHHFKYQINFHTISTSKEHPLAHGPCVVLGSHKPIGHMTSCSAMVAVFGDHLAFYGAVNERGNQYRTLHVWNWHQDDQNDDISVFGGCDSSELFDLRFLTKEKLLALTHDHIELYNVERVPMVPVLQARFMLAVGYTRFRYPSVFHSAQTCASTAAHEHWLWTTNPADQVICVELTPSENLVISARIFFMDIPHTWFDATSGDRLYIPWLSWGPQNSRCLPREVLQFGVGGSRVVWAVPVSGSELGRPKFKLHMTDFNPSAVARGIGKVVREPTTATFRRSKRVVTTFLPYVEVVNDRIFNANVRTIVLNEESIVMIARYPETDKDQKVVEIFSM